MAPRSANSWVLSVREYTKQELTDATRYYAAQVNALADDVSRDNQGLARLSSFEELSKQAGAGYDKLAARYELFTGSHDPVKKLATWRMFSQFGITGIFVCFTGEACVNPDTYEVWLPFTMCHELAHRQTVARRGRRKFLRVSCVHGKQKPGVSVFRRDRGLCLLPQRAL